MLYVVIVIAAVAFFAGTCWGEARMEHRKNEEIAGHKLITNALIEDMSCCIADAIKLQDERDELVDQINAMNAVFADMMEGYESVRQIVSNN